MNVDEGVESIMWEGRGESERSEDEENECLNNLSSRTVAGKRKKKER